MNDAAELSRLQAENARLIALLESLGIEWRPPQPVVLVAQEPEPSRLSTAEKVALFRRLFRGRTDVYPVRWEGKTSGESGYAPACANEWRAGVCEKPRIERFGGEPIDVSFFDTLRLDQEAAVAGMLPHDAGVLCAPTAFGKTVTAAAMVARPPKATQTPPLMATSNSPT